MKRTRIPMSVRSAAVVVTSVLALTSCTPSGAFDNAEPARVTTTPYRPAPTSTVLKAGHSSLGDIAVDHAGRTVYTYADDKQGTAQSECSGECLTAWPAVPVKAKLEGKGISAKLGTATSAGGTAQLTLNGFPLYYFAGDAKVGDVNGQGDEGEWWVISPAGDKILSVPSGSTASVPDDDDS
jgi:predicted lipoprotein with Yx(FWY)xxD motif